MGQKIVVKVVFSASRGSWESFGNSRYILKIPCVEDSSAKEVVSSAISRYIGVPASKIVFQGQDLRKNWVFEVL